MDKDHIQMGNGIALEAREAVKEVGWERAVLAAIMVNIEAANKFFKNIPNLGKPGQTIITDEKFFDEYQELVISEALLTAMIAERVGQDLTMHASEPN